MATQGSRKSSSATTRDNQSGAAASKKWWALAATCFGLFMVLLDITIVNVAIPTIGTDLKASITDLQWVLNAYNIALAVFLVTAGRVGDILGRKSIFMLGLAIFTVGSLGCALSGQVAILGLTHTTFLFASRAVQGLGGSFMLPLSLAIITATFEGPERGTAIGIWGGVTGLATAIGPVVGGVLVKGAGWPWIFAINIPIGIIGIGLSYWAITESRDEQTDRSIDIIGLVTSAAFVFCLILGLIQANDSDKGWTSPYILTLFAISAVALVLFVVLELRIKNPMADPRLFLIPSFAASAIVVFMLSAGFYSLLFFLTLYLQNTLGYDALGAGVRFLTLSALIMVGAPLAGALTDRIGAKPILVVATALLTIAVLTMTRLSTSDFANTAWLALLPGFVLGGFASGMINPPTSTLAVGVVERNLAGMASGVNTLARQVGSAFGIAFLLAILTSRYNSHIKDAILGIQQPGLTGPVKEHLASQLQSAGLFAGSYGLEGTYPGSKAYQAQAIFPTLSRLARQSFIQGTTDILYVAAVMIALSLVASVFLIRRSDMKYAPGEAMPIAAAG